MDVSAELLAIVAAAVGLAALIMRSISRTDSLIDRTDQRIDRTDQRIDRTDQRIDRFDDAMAVFRSEMQLIAERQARVEGRLDERGSATD